LEVPYPPPPVGVGGIRPWGATASVDPPYRSGRERLRPFAAIVPLAGRALRVSGPFL